MKITQLFFLFAIVINVFCAKTKA